MTNFPNKDKLVKNFSYCSNWEEKYLYLIELGDLLTPFPQTMRTKKYLISGCQSQVWIAVRLDKNKTVQLYGDSDALLVKGLISVLFIIYKEMTLTEIIGYDVQPILSALALSQHLTPARSQGLDLMVKSIRRQAINKRLSCNLTLYTPAAAESKLT